MAVTLKKRSTLTPSALRPPWWMRFRNVALMFVVAAVFGLYIVSAQQAAYAQDLVKEQLFDRAISQMELAHQYFPLMPRQGQIDRFNALKSSFLSYQQGVSAYNQQDWESAAGYFRLVIDQDDQYQSAQDYLKQLQTKESEDEPVVLTQISHLPGNEIGLDSSGQIQVPILMYHYISENPNPQDVLRTELSVPPTAFDAQMKYLVDHDYHTVTMQQLTAALQGQGLLPPKPVVLTFDDGYVDFYQQAYPILFKYQLQGTLFVITNSTSHDPRYATWDQIRLMAKSGLVEIGSHTVSHPDLRQVSDAQLTLELTQSKASLEEQLGTGIPVLAYPIGGYNDRVVNAARSAGYSAAVTTAYGSWHRADQLLSLTRIRIKNQPMSNYLSE